MATTDMAMTDMAMTDVAIRLFGPVTVLADGAARPVPGLRRGAVLAALALQPGEVVSIERLADIVWDDAAPKTATQTLRSHLSHVRRILRGRASIVARSAGYVLKLTDTTTDVAVAEQLIGQADRYRDCHQRKAALQAALARWTAPPLEDLTALDWFAIQARRLDQLLLHAQEMLIEARMELGEHQQVLPVLEQLSRQHPFHEPLHGQLILALYRCGRQADALSSFQQLKTALDEELGILPGTEIRDLHTAILRQDPALASPSSAAVVTANSITQMTPEQLPPALTTFVARKSELVHLDGLLAGAQNGLGPVVVAISGTAGVGKTALAVQWAHGAVTEFPDGRLYLNLRGYGPDGSSPDSADAVRQVLDLLGVSAERIPATVEAQVGLYRSMLAGKRILILLDNARDADQIRALLPGSPGSAVLVTSRHQLTSLAATHGAHLLTVDPLSTEEARDLVARRVGPDRVAAEPDAINQLISLCGGLPLALAITAAHANAHPTIALSALAAQIRDTAPNLDRFQGGDPATDLRAVFSRSYDALAPDAARLFRWLGIHPGPDIGTAAVASLAALPEQRARAVLTQLTRAHLVTQHASDRYMLHDLLRDFAAELAGIHDTDQDRRTVRRRMLDHYLHCAHAASALLETSGPASLLTLEPAAPGVVVEPLGDTRAALDWFRAQRATLVELAARLAREGHGIPAWHLSIVLSTFLDRQGHWTDLWTVHSLALDAAGRAGDLRGQAAVRLGLGLCASRLGKLDEAEEQWTTARDLAARSGDRARQARALLNLASLAEQHGEHAKAAAYAEQALALYRSLGNRTGVARALNSLGWNQAHLGDHVGALARCRSALPLHQADGDLDGEANTWASIGDIHHDQGDLPPAATCYRRAAELYRDIGNRYLEATALTGLGDCEGASGHRAAAEAAWRRAAGILDDMSHPSAEQVRHRLSR